jgi:hypothetical protein
MAEDEEGTIGEFVMGAGAHGESESVRLGGEQRRQQDESGG